MASNKKPNRTNFQADDLQLIAGLQKHATTVATLLISGVPHDNASIAAVLKARVDAGNSTLAARAAWQTAVKAERDERAKTKAFVSGVRQALKVAFAGSIDTLADFGLTPRKVPVRTPEQKAAATAKALATRAARHTMGPKQKKQVTGQSAAAAARASSPTNAQAAAPAPVTTWPATGPAATSPVTPMAAPAPASPSPAPAPGTTNPPHAS